MKSRFTPDIFRRDGLPMSSLHLREDYMTLDGDEKKVCVWNSHSSQNPLLVCVLTFDEQRQHGARSESKWLMCTFRHTGTKGDTIPKELFETES